MAFLRMTITQHYTDSSAMSWRMPLSEMLSKVLTSSTNPLSKAP